MAISSTDMKMSQYFHKTVKKIFFVFVLDSDSLLVTARKSVRTGVGNLIKIPGKPIKKVSSGETFLSCNSFVLYYFLYKISKRPYLISSLPFRLVLKVFKSVSQSDQYGGGGALVLMRRLSTKGSHKCALCNWWG